LCQRSGIKRPLCVVVYSKLGISIRPYMLYNDHILYPLRLYAFITRVIPRTCFFSTGWFYEPMFSSKFYFVEKCNDMIAALAVASCTGTVLIWSFLPDMYGHERFET